jgi:anti-anti-sigma factor
MSNATALALGEDLTVYAVHALKPRLLAALDDQPALSLDLSEVCEIDGAGVQLLLATRREAHKRGGSLCLSAVSPTAHEALTLIDQLDALTTAPVQEKRP